MHNIISETNAPAYNVDPSFLAQMKETPGSHPDRLPTLGDDPEGVIRGFGDLLNEVDDEVESHFSSLSLTSEILGIGVGELLESELFTGDQQEVLLDAVQSAQYAEVVVKADRYDNDPLGTFTNLRDIGKSGKITFYRQKILEQVGSTEESPDINSLEFGLATMYVYAHEVGHALSSAISHRAGIELSNLTLIADPHEAYTNNLATGAAIEEERFAEGFAQLVMSEIAKSAGLSGSDEYKAIDRELLNRNMTGKRLKDHFNFGMYDTSDRVDVERSIATHVPDQSAKDDENLGLLGYAVPLSKSQLIERLSRATHMISDMDMSPEDPLFNIRELNDRFNNSSYGQYDLPGDEGETVLNWQQYISSVQEKTHIKGKGLRAKVLPTGMNRYVKAYEPESLPSRRIRNIVKSFADTARNIKGLSKRKQALVAVAGLVLVAGTIKTADIISDHIYSEPSIAEVEDYSPRPLTQEEIDQLMEERDFNVKGPVESGPDDDSAPSGG